MHVLENRLSAAGQETLSAVNNIWMARKMLCFVLFLLIQIPFISMISIAMCLLF